MTKESDNARPFRKKLGIKTGVQLPRDPRLDTGVRLPGMVDPRPEHTHRDAAAEVKKSEEERRRREELERTILDGPEDEDGEENS